MLQAGDYVRAYNYHISKKSMGRILAIKEIKKWHKHKLTYVRVFYILSNFDSKDYIFVANKVRFVRKGKFSPNQLKGYEAIWNNGKRDVVFFHKDMPLLCAVQTMELEVVLMPIEDDVYRLKPRENPHVNQWWMCDEGRYGTSGTI